MATGYFRYGEAFRKLHNNDPSCELLNCIQGIQLLANGTLNIKDANLFDVNSPIFEEKWHRNS